MKQFTAFYTPKEATTAYTYDKCTFDAADIEKAKDYCKKIPSNDILIIDHEMQETTAIGDAFKCDELERVYLAINGTLMS